MGFFQGYILGSSEGSNEQKSGGGGLFSYLIIGLFLFNLFTGIEDWILKNFSDKLIETAIVFIIVTILQYRYNYHVRVRGLEATLIGMLISIVNALVCFGVGIIIFHFIGHTPFDLLIDLMKPLNWDSNFIIDIVGEVIWLILKISHIYLRIAGLYTIQSLILKKIRDKKMKKFKDGYYEDNVRFNSK